MMPNPVDPIEIFINRWSQSAGAERANYTLFLSELCDVLGVPRPNPSQTLDSQNSYVFEKTVRTEDGNSRFIDLYKRNCFVLEAKQGSEQEAKPALASAATLQEFAQRKKGTAVRGTMQWDTEMVKAKNQGENYIRLLAGEEIRNGRPPFLLVVDVGNTIELYAEFTRTGGRYVPFPDPASHRLTLDDLREPDVRQVLAQIWTNPQELDPTRRSAKVTRLIAEKLGALAKQLEADNYQADEVANFLMRCLFTMFAEDVGLLPAQSFADLLDDLGNDPISFKPMVEALWQTMNTGGFSVILRQQLPRFNGGLFADPFALPLHKGQIGLLAEAARADWRDVEPAIFGTLLERALNPVERHKLGAHYTPRAYVERLVQPTVIEPLRVEWEAVQAAALLLSENGETAKAMAEVESFLHRLTSLRVLDPACGSGNFLYVTLELLKRLEGEVLNILRELGDDRLRLDMQSVTVSPQQFLGIEVNPRAAAIAELVLWIGYLQWHFRTQGKTNPPEPIIKNYHNIECRDAVLAWEGVEPLRDSNGQVVTRWDDRTMKKDPVTGNDVPDDTALVEAVRYLKPRKAAWPQANFIVGNPPFVANRNLRAELGDGYVEALGQAYPEINEAVDLVMYFWFTAAKAVISKKTIRAGLITTNSIRMIQNQGVVIRAVQKGAKFVFAIPDHPWLNDSGQAKVRVSMTVIGHKKRELGDAYLLLAPGHDEVARERADTDVLKDTDFKVLKRKEISTDLSPLVDISGIVELECWNDLCHAGMKPYAQNLIIDSDTAKKLFSDIEERSNHAPPYRNGRDIARTPRGVHVLDFYGLSEKEIRDRYPKAFQHLIAYVLPYRIKERNPKLRENWWLFEANRPILREAIANIDRYIVTVENAPVRYFVFLEKYILPDQKLRVIACDDYYVLGVLSTKWHMLFSLRVGGRQGVANTPVYNTRCTTAFPFPEATEVQKEEIRQLAEQLDAHRKRQQAQHPTLTMTGMYNVLEKLRQEEPLDDNERAIHEMGLLTILHHLHQDLDRAVSAAYGWPATLSDEEILSRLVALNQERAAEEANGLIRYLRPAYQNPNAVGQTHLIDVPQAIGVGAGVAEARPWPKALPEQMLAVRQLLQGVKRPLSVPDVTQSFAGKPTKQRRESVAVLLETLAMLGQAVKVEGGYTAV